MARGYQHGFAQQHGGGMYDRVGRERKAETLLAIVRDVVGDAGLQKMQALDVGASTGIIDHYLAQHLGHVTGIDIDAQAVAHAQQSFLRDNLLFAQGDAMQLAYQDNCFDLVVCSQVYEHVPDAERMMEEIFRVLRPGGICYFAATNRLDIHEHHYQLPFLSVIPRPLGHWYVRLAGRADYYYEKHFSVWTLRAMVRKFELIDYTRQVINEPARYGAAYMLPPGSLRHRVARFMARWLYFLVPGYLWVLRKPQ